MSSHSTDSKLDALTGLHAAKRAVRGILDQSGVHAVLLYGPEGCGKTELARILTQGWLCVKPTPAGACGECQACRAMERGNTADLLWISPTGPSAIIRRNAICQMTSPPGEKPPVALRDEFFRTPPLTARNKVAVIEDAHRMNGEAANALLKTLEEPPPKSKLILTTSSVSLVLATILSRCLAVACELPTREELRLAFPDATDSEVLLASGSPGQLSRILSRREKYGRLVSFASDLRQRRAGDALVVSDQFRQICEGFESKEIGARAANSEALGLLAVMLASDTDLGPRAAQRIIESHRRIVQNGSPGQVFDALFSAILVNR